MLWEDKKKNQEISLSVLEYFLRVPYFDGQVYCSLMSFKRAIHNISFDSNLVLVPLVEQFPNEDFIAQIRHTEVLMVKWKRDLLQEILVVLKEYRVKRYGFIDVASGFNRWMNSDRLWIPRTTM